MKPIKTYYYRNLRKDCYSVMRRGIVIDHVEEAFIRNAEFRVRAAGRDKVRATGAKNVHAFVVGERDEDGSHCVAYFDSQPTYRVTYDPYRYDTFVEVNGERPILGAELVRISPGGVIFVRGEIQWG